MPTPSPRAASLSDDRVAKRPRSALVLSATTSFKIRFEQLASIKSLIDVVGNVLGRVYIQLKACKREPGSVVLTVDTIDAQHVCIVQARLVCTGAVAGDGGAGEEIAFCVDTSTLSKCLQNVSPHLSVELVGTRGVADITLRCYDPMTNVDDLSFTLHTFEDECEYTPLEDIEYEYVHEIDLAALKRIVKLAGSLKVDNLRLAMHVADDDGGGSATSSTSSLRSITEISGSGEAVFSRQMTSSVTQEGDDAIRGDDEALTADVLARAKLQYAASFSYEYLSKFVKGMEHNNVQLKFGADKPLLVHYPLGVPDSFVRFILAPKSDDGGTA